MSLNLSLYANRSDIAAGHSQKTIAAEKSEHPILNFLKLHTYSFDNLTVYGFKEGLLDDDEQVTILINMLIPQYFEELEDLNHELHGLFLTQLGKVSDAKDFIDDVLSLGRFGCPKRLIISSNAAIDHFSFNRMRFYPFIMTDFTVGYYICDEGTTELHWPPHSPQEKGVALDYPVAYEPTLGIFMTRAAHIVSPPTPPVVPPEVSRRGKS